MMMMMIEFINSVTGNFKSQNSEDSGLIIPTLLFIIFSLMLCAFW